MTKLERLLVIPVSLCTRTSPKKYLLAEIDRETLLPDFVPTASRNHSWFEEMAGPAKLRLGGESAFVFVVVQAT